MLFSEICVGITLGMVILETWSLPVQNSSAVDESRLRLKRTYSGKKIHPDEMNAMDQILLANKRVKSVMGVSLKDGDIARSHLRSAISCPGSNCRWPKSVDGFVYLPYIISSQYNDMDRITIETGMLDIASVTCIKFVPRTHEANYVDIQPKLGCWSFLGMTGGAQTLSLQSPNCMWSGVASHEFMHALGFVHEQSRSDRDYHVTILWENIIQGQRHNFQKHKTNNLNTAYDYSSIMHYGKYAFSEDGEPTIIPKQDPNIHIGQRDGPSATDIHKINILYDCDVIFFYTISSMNPY
ncbi:high choriolytic enzyme 1 isoform X2 [Denticeps clupeoides]|uniref:Metalloendopeptidase n=1 Tax=Denticeps clupeoides TaxID=299321 RepID=A0AAY4BLK2_9TELE|nr:high choriolytic enzyme 1-like isoform X2 [Denticeps clupeoides]